MYAPIEIHRYEPPFHRLVLLITPLALCEQLTDAERVKPKKIANDLELSVTDDGRVVDIYVDAAEYRALHDGRDVVTLELTNAPARIVTNEPYPGVDVSRCATSGALFRIRIRNPCR